MRRVAVLLAAVAASPALVPAGATAAPSSDLPAFTSCDDLVGYARRNLRRPAVSPQVTAMRAPGSVGPRPALAEPPPASPGDMPIAAAAPAAASESAPVEGEDFSGTNVQEQGIDEPDVVKTDGRRLYVVAGSELRAYDITGDSPRVLGRVTLGGPAEILLRGSRVLAISAAPAMGAVAATVAVPGSGATQLTEVDATDPAAMRIARTMEVPGIAVTARLTGGTARVVISSPPSLEQPSSPTAVAASAKTQPRLSAFVPRTVLRSRITRRTFRRALVPCAAVRHPAAYSGNDLLTVLSIDLDRGLFDVDRDAVLAGAQVVYASPTGLYVASRRATALAPGDVPEASRTEIHRFDTTVPGQTTYAASGDVTGFVLNQYALSEYRGDLRVASTEEPQWLSEDPAARESRSAVTVLRQRGGALQQVGRVGGLGRNERIYAARFIDDVAYLVTFRQVDPLYTVDLADPTRPRVAGELKIPGYSAYLHPIGDGLLLGVGQDATPEGRRTGAQVSVFDVRDPARPVRLHQASLGAAASAAEFDPHAFLWWAKAKLALLPFSDWDPNVGRADNGMVGLRAGRAEGLIEVGRITHGPEWDRAPVERAVVVGDRVLTVSDLGVATHRIEGLTPVGFLPFVG